jgi:hypothetical protein
MKRTYHVILVMLFLVQHSYCQESVGQSGLAHFSKPLNTLSLVLPAALIGLGVAGLRDDELLEMNNHVAEEVLENRREKVKIDNVMQYLPLISVYSLNLSGIKGRSAWKERTIIAASSYFVMGSVVLGLKQLVKEERPDKSGFNSFPSGHTATAFAGAEFLWQEYKDVSVWYGISGYVVAAGTGLFRVYNDKHWMTDVFAGAGIGILSTKLVYMVYPLITKRENRKKSSSITPFINVYADDKETGFDLNLEF